MSQKKAKILVADDNITNRQVTLAVLDNLGMHADGVTNGKEAVQALSSCHYDLVLMDCQMPGIDGFAATRLIRDQGSEVLDHDIPVIAMTAHSDAAIEAQCLASGMNDFLAKPLLPEPLEKKINQWLAPSEDGSRQDASESPAVRGRPAAPASELPIWDQEGMHARLMGDTHVAFIISQGFLQDMPQQIGKLEDYLSAGNVEGLKRQAHSIKGAAAVVGGKRLSALAEKIEHLSQKNPTALGPAVKLVTQEFSCLEQEMSRRSKI